MSHIAGYAKIISDRGGTLVVAKLDRLARPVPDARAHASGDYSIADRAELFTVSRPTVYRTLQRTQSA